MRWFCALALACFLLVLGAALRPMFDDAAAAPEPLLSVAEIGFAQDMAVHHAQALTIANSLSSDASPEVGVLAQQIATSQSIEIGILQGWLTLLDEPLSSSTPMQWMHPTGTHTHSTSTPMPGIASWPEITELSALTGTEAEIRFLQLMERHHRGGIEMATAGAELATTPVVVRTARSMIDEQAKDIGYMSMLLEQREASVLPYP